jgi:virulence factor Mce-like protein
MRRILLSAVVLAAVGAFLLLTVGASKPSPVGKYVIDLDNAFGLTSGADFKVAGVPAGKVGTIELPQGCAKGGGDTSCFARVNVTVTQRGFGQFRTDAFCQSRPQSLIGEYFVECTPGTKGKVIPPGGTIPRAQTQSTIPFDLLQDVSQMPYRQRLTLIINELGATVAGRSGDLQQALRRAVPALTQTDNLLNLLANDSRSIQALTSDSNTVITDLANNSKQVQRFIEEANNTAKASATQASNISATWHKLPTFLEELKPTMKDLGDAADANEPVLRNLLASAGQLHTLFTNLASCSSPHADRQCGFSDASLTSLRPLGQASITGKAAVQAARPTIRHLNTMTGGSGCLQHDLSLDAAGHAYGGLSSGFRQTCLPELAQNLAIVAHDLDDPSRAVEPDTRSPGGKGFSGLEALLWYAFVQPLSINTYTQFGHILNVNAFIDPICSPYATPQSIANNLATNPSKTRQCYAWYGPSQPGVNETDPSDPGACVPDPGGKPTSPQDTGPGPATSACKLQANPAKPKSADTSNSTVQTAADTGGSSSSSGSTGGGSSGGGSSGASSGSSGSSGSNGSSSSGPSGSNAASSSSPSGGAGSGSAGQAQQLLNYLLAP